MIWCFAKKFYTRHDAWVDTLSCWGCQSPVAHSSGLLNQPNSFHRRMFKLNAKSDADSLLYILSHFECDGHTVHVLTQWHLPPPLTSAVKLSLFTLVHSSPLSLAARLHWCHTNHFLYTDNGRAFYGQTSCVCVYLHVYVCVWIYAYIHVCVHIYIYTYKCIYSDRIWLMYIWQVFMDKCQRKTSWALIFIACINLMIFRNFPCAIGNK